MKHLKPVSKAVIVSNPLVQLIQLLISLGLVNLDDLFKKQDEVPD